MASHSIERGNLFPQQTKRSVYAVRLLAAAAMAYGFLAGFHTLQDFDLGWQLATGRWVLQHHLVFSDDVFSHTAQGQPWMYPALSGVVFYLMYRIGGYSLLCWSGAACSAGTIALLVRRGAFETAALALIAVPSIASRTQPRAEMFTTILFAMFLSLLWEHHAGGKARLWVLPVLMVLWVNLHLGFVAGLALCGAYVLLEVAALPFPQGWVKARARLRRAWPWLALTAAATFVNPWSARLYMAFVRQERTQEFHNAWIVEWERLRPSWNSLHQALDWRDPQSGFWWLLFAAALCAGVALFRKRIAAAVLLAASGYAGIHHVRMQALFACVVVVVGGSVLREVLPNQALANQALGRHGGCRNAARYASTIAAVVLCLLTVVRGFDLVSNRYYLRSPQLSSFGTGLSWWFPERAINFIKKERLPANVFNGYELGGFLTWQLPEHPDYIDGRAIPFGKELFFKAYELSVAPPDSEVWRREAEARGINTIVVSLARYQGIALFPQLQAFCRGEAWRAVYMDEVSAVFVRRSAATAELVDRLQIDCGKVQFGSPVELSSPSPLLAKTARNGAPGFNFYANAAGVLYALGRYPEALTYLARAQSIFSDNANLHLTRALVLEHSGHAADAEAEFRTSLRLEPTDEAWLDLGLFYMTERRYGDAAQVFRRSAETSARPHDAWMLLGQAELQMGRPQAALEAFDKAEAASPFHREDEEEALGAGFESMVATGRAKAWYRFGDVAKAVSYQEEAVRLAPGDGKLWSGLADLYQAQGRGEDAEWARENAARARTSH